MTNPQFGGRSSARSGSTATRSRSLRTARRRSTHSRRKPADAVILDVAMPRLDGLEVCRRLRQAGDRTPVLMLTARDAIDDRVQGLDVGADDYLVKPFALRELQARLRALLRRSSDGSDGETLHYADLELDPVAHEVRRGDRVIELSKTEFSLLELFLSTRGRC